MKNLVRLSVLLMAPLSAFSLPRLIPAGSLVQCTVSEPRLSSKTADVGDPVLCQVSPVELYGRSMLPYDSYLEGRFEDYKDPGHFVGKGWMELKFDKMVIPPGQVVPVAAKVVYVPKYNVDKTGKIYGKGHTARDIAEWSIPVLWPIDLLTLPRRGPRPTLKAETRLTLKIMDDLLIPGQEETAAAQSYPQPVARDPYGFAQRPQMYYTPQPPAPPAYLPQISAPLPGYVPQAVPIARSVRYGGPDPVASQPLTILVLRDGNVRLATDYWFEGAWRVRYIDTNGRSIVIPLEALDLARTVEMNRSQGVPFVIRSTAY